MVSRLQKECSSAKCVVFVSKTGPLQWKKRKAEAEGRRVGHWASPWDCEAVGVWRPALLRQSKSLHLPGIMVRRGIKAGRADDCTELTSSIFGRWRSRRRAQDDDQRMHKSTDFLRRIIVPIEGQGGVTLSYVWPYCH